MAVKKRKRPALLSHTRPRLPTKQLTPSTPTVSLSSKATRNLIRSHHQLLKARERAVLAGDASLISQIDAQIDANGGLESYQLASKTGQSRERGGDSSTVFLEWIRPLLRRIKQARQQTEASSAGKLRLLEVGALSTKNACSQHECINVTRIDLHSQEPGILQQDFMERPLPAATADSADDKERFHAISLSLVLNYVPSAAQRGEMFKRCSAFFTTFPPCSLPTTENTDFAPYLFLVLPAACVLNSRYFNPERLNDIATSLGYSKLKEKVTNKLIYQLWEFRPLPLDNSNKKQSARIFRKEELNPGKTRNNFTITLNAKP
jgi:25S rRNA (adenine2142-N1)-methyltransferase